MMYHKSGLSCIMTIDLGILCVYSFILAPRPPHKITIFIYTTISSFYHTSSHLFSWLLDIEHMVYYLCICLPFGCPFLPFIFFFKLFFVHFFNRFLFSCKPSHSLAVFMNT